MAGTGPSERVIVTMGVMFLPTLSQKCLVAQLPKLPTKPYPLPEEHAMLELVGVRYQKCLNRILVDGSDQPKMLHKVSKSQFSASYTYIK